MLRTSLLSAFCFALASQGALAAMSAPPDLADPKLGAMIYGAESLVHWADKMPTGDTARGARLLADVDKLRGRLSRVRGADPAQMAVLDAYLQSLSAEIATKAMPTPVATPQPLAVTPPVAPAAPKQPQASLQPLATAIVLDAPMTPPEPVARISHEEGARIVSEIQSKFANGGPFELPAPHRFFGGGEVTRDKVADLMVLLRAHVTAAEQDVVRLQQVHAATGQGDYWLRWIGGEAMARFDADLARYVAQRLATTTREMQRVETQAGFDPDTHGSELRGDFAAKTMARNDAVLETMRAMMALEFAFDLPREHAPRVDGFVAAMRTYAAKVAEVESGVTTTLPRDIGDAGLREIAQAVLAKPRYGATEWTRLVVNAPLSPRDRIEHRVWNGKIETIARVWEEFQVTTVERAADGRLFVYHNTVAKFSRAPQTTPIGEWLLTQRIKGSPIAEDRL